jgi:hypothetical protein
MRSSLEPNNAPFRNTMPSLAKVKASGKKKLPDDQRLHRYLFSANRTAAAEFFGSVGGSAVLSMIRRRLASANS